MEQQISSDPFLLNVVGFVTNSDSVIRLAVPTPAQLSVIPSLLSLVALEQLTLGRLPSYPVPLASLSALGSCIGSSNTVTSFSMEESLAPTSKYSAEAAAAIVQTFVDALRAPSMRSVTISHVSLVDPVNKTLASALVNSRSLVALSVCDCELTTANAEEFANLLRGLLPRLESLSLCSSRLNSKCAKLFLGANLRSLTLRRVHLDVEGGLDLGRALRKCIRLRKLEINECFTSLKNKGIAIMIKGLLQAGRWAPKLESVNFSRNGTKSKVLARLFERNPHLASITISNNSVTDFPGAVITHSLSACRFTLRELNAASCCFGDKMVSALASALGEANVLSSLNLWGNAIKDTGAKVIALQMLPQGTLVRLNIGNNQITSVGAKYLAQGLEDSPGGLQSLSVDLNQIGAGAVILLDTISQHRCLPVEEVDFSGCEIGDAGAAALARLIRRDKRLRRVVAAKCKFGLVGVKAISAAIADGKGIQELEMGEDCTNVDVRMAIEEITRRVQSKA